MATKGTRYYNLQVKMERALEILMLDDECSLLEAQITLRGVIGDAVDTLREKYAPEKFVCKGLCGDVFDTSKERAEHRCYTAGRVK